MKKYRTAVALPLVERPVGQSLDMNITKLTVPSVLEQFNVSKRSYFSGADKRECIVIHDDIYMLFNQKRLLASGVGVDTLKAWLDTLAPVNDSLSQLRKKCTDEQLMAFCKSRYIQSPSELLAWSEYLLANHEAELARLDTAYKEQLENHVRSKDTSSATTEQIEANSE